MVISALSLFFGKTTLHPLITRHECKSLELENNQIFPMRKSKHLCAHKTTLANKKARFVNTLSVVYKGDLYPLSQEIELNQ